MFWTKLIHLVSTILWQNSSSKCSDIVVPKSAVKVDEAKNEDDDDDDDVFYDTEDDPKDDADDDMSDSVV